MVVLSNRFPLFPNREQKDKNLDREHFGSGFKNKLTKKIRTKKQHHNTAAFMEKTFTPP